jgi:hypothetical protein
MDPRSPMLIMRFWTCFVTLFLFLERLDSLKLIIEILEILEPLHRNYWGFDLFTSLHEVFPTKFGRPVLDGVYPAFKFWAWLRILGGLNSVKGYLENCKLSWTSQHMILDLKVVHLESILQSYVNYVLRFF